MDAARIVSSEGGVAGLQGLDEVRHVAVPILRLKGLLQLNQISLPFRNRTACHDVEGIARDLAERERIIEDFGPQPVLVLRNHVLIATGRSAAEMFSTSNARGGFRWGRCPRVSRCDGGGRRSRPMCMANTC